MSERRERIATRVDPLASRSARGSYQARGGTTRTFSGQVIYVMRRYMAEQEGPTLSAATPRKSSKSRKA